MIARIVAAMTARLKTIEEEKKKKSTPVNKKRNRSSNTSRGVGRYMGTNRNLDVLKLDE